MSIETLPLSTNFIRVGYGEQLGPELSGSWSGEVMPGSITLDKLRRQKEYPFKLGNLVNMRKQGQALIVCQGVAEVHIAKGTMILWGVCDCLGLLLQYQLPNGKIEINAAHKSAIHGYGMNTIHDLMQKIQPQEPKSLNVGIYGNFPTEHLLKFVELLPRVEAEYKNLLMGSLPNTRIKLDLKLGSTNWSGDTYPFVCAVASTDSMNSFGSKIFHVKKSKVGY